MAEWRHDDDPVFVAGIPFIAMVRTIDGQETSKSDSQAPPGAQPVSLENGTGILAGSPVQKQLHVPRRSARGEALVGEDPALRNPQDVFAASD